MCVVCGVEWGPGVGFAEAEERGIVEGMSAGPNLISRRPVAVEQECRWALRLQAVHLEASYICRELPLTKLPCLTPLPSPLLQVDKVIVLWTANTERYSEVVEGLNDTSANLLASIQRGEAEVSPSTLYATACVLEGVPFINGSPQNTFVPGLIDLAVEKNVLIGERGGREAGGSWEEGGGDINLYVNKLFLLGNCTAEAAVAAPVPCSAVYNHGITAPWHCCTPWPQCCSRLFLFSCLIASRWPLSSTANLALPWPWLYYAGGDDFKSGQTKMKSVLVDFLVGAGLKPTSIVSYNHLGNNDGMNLSAPQTFRSKEISKSNVVDDMVQSNALLYK